MKEDEAQRLMSSPFVDGSRQMQRAGLGAQKRCLGSEAESGRSKGMERGWTACLLDEGPCRLGERATETPPFGRQG